MFTEQTCEVVVTDDPDPPRPKRKPRRRPRGSRDPNRASRYEQRKLAGLCTTCGRPAVPDRQMCAAHLDAARVATRKAMRQRRKDLHTAGLCTNGCGRPSTTWRCFVCAVRAGETPASSPAETNVNEGVNAGRDRIDGASKSAEAGFRSVTEGDGRTRNRYVVRKKGHPSRQDEDDWDIRAAEAEIDRAKVALASFYSPEVQALPRVQRDAALIDFVAHIELAQRFLAELKARAERRVR